MLGAKGTGDALQVVRNLPDPNNPARKLEPTFCEPGDVLPLPGTGVQAYVLGPPIDFERLRRMGSNSDEALYHDADTKHDDTEEGVRNTARVPTSALALRREAIGLTPFGAFAAAISDIDVGDADDPEDRDMWERSFPFDASARIPWPIAEEDSKDSASRY